MAEDPRTVLSDPRAPADERYDAQAELGAVYKPLSSALLPSEDIQRVIQHIQDDLADQDMMKARSGGARILQFPDQRGGAEAPKRGMQSVFLDPLQIFANGEFYEKPSPVGFEALRSMVEQTPILNAVIMTRIRQISRFCQPSEDGGQGFEIRHKDRKHKLTGAEAESAALLARFFQNCGWEFNPRARKRLRRDNFTQFMAKLVRDSLTMDACPIETELKRNKALGIDGLYAVDGTTIRLCTEDGYEGDDEIYALQVIQGRVTTAYSYDHLIYEVRNPRADVRLAGYGLGETELMIRVVTGFLNAMAYNINGFDKNSIPRGILHLSGDYDKADLAAFKRYWNSTVKGINNSWALPIMVSKDQDSKAEFEKIDVEFNEMYFSKWMTFLVSIICSIYGMSPDEINFESFSASKSSLSGSDTEAKLANSKDLGLHPNMAFFESMLTDFVVTEFSDKFCFRFVGLEDENEDRDWEAKKLILTVDELRAEQGYEPMGAETGMGAAPLNPSLVGPWQQAQQMAAQPPQGADFGGPPGEDQPDYGNPGDGEDGGAPGQGKPPEPGSNEGGAMPPKAGPPAGGGDFGSSAGPPPDGSGEPMTKAAPVIYSIEG